VTSGALLRGLFAAYARGDDVAFRRAAAQIVESERGKGHSALAADLELEINRSGRVGGDPPLSLRPVPRGRDDRQLLRLTKPARTFEELVLHPGVCAVLAAVSEENLRRGALLAHGLNPRQRLLFVGPPGTGKSAAASALAAELSLPLATVSLAALTSSLLGETARNIEAVLEFARLTPCVLLFDEFDVLGQERDRSGDHGELRRVVATVLQALEEMRGESVVVATTNHAASFDSALWRRFDEVVTFGALDAAGATELAALRLRALPHRLDLATWGVRLAALAPADIESVCHDALRASIMESAVEVTPDTFGQALTRMESRRATSTARPDDFGRTAHPTSS
jgi:ATPase family associated with various cellular activities (AAA)